MNYDRMVEWYIVDLKKRGVGFTTCICQNQFTSENNVKNPNVYVTIWTDRLKYLQVYTVIWQAVLLSTGVPVSLLNANAKMVYCWEDVKLSYLNMESLTESQLTLVPSDWNFTHKFSPLLLAYNCVKLSTTIVVTFVV